MKAMAGPIAMIDTQPPHLERAQEAKTGVWDGNQATYLCIPTFAGFLLVLMATLSSGIIPGISIATIHADGLGTVQVGAYGWCINNDTLTSKCATHPAFGRDPANLTELPEYVQGALMVSPAIPDAYAIGNLAMHSLATCITWLTVTWSLAASGAWHNKEQHAWVWTSRGFVLTIWSSIFILIPWALDLDTITRLQEHLRDVNQGHTRVTPGPAIWMMMIAFILNLGCVIARAGWLRYLPRPLWTMKGREDFVSQNPPPLSATLPPPAEQPPTWESLNLQTAALDEKKGLETYVHEQAVPSVEQRGFAV